MRRSTSSASSTAPTARFREARWTASGSRASPPGRTEEELYLATILDPARRYCVRPATNRWADQSANGFSCRGSARKTPALILAFSLCVSRKIIRSSLIRVGGWPSSRQASFSFRRVRPPGPLRPSRHEPHGGDERVEQAGVVALARLLAQVLVQRIGVTARQVGGGGYAQPPKVGGDGWADVGDVFQGGDILSSPGLASSSSSGWPLHYRGSFSPSVVGVATCGPFYRRGPLSARPTCAIIQVYSASSRPAEG